MDSFRRGSRTHYPDCSGGSGCVDRVRWATFASSRSIANFWRTCHVWKALARCSWLNGEVIDGSPLRAFPVLLVGGFTGPEVVCQPEQAEAYRSDNDLTDERRDKRNPLAHAQII